MKQLALFVVTLLAAPLLQADFCCEAWRPLIGIESGVLMTSNAGHSKTFPASESGSQEFYKYSCHHKFQTKPFYGGFVGLEWQGSPYWNIQFTASYNQSTPFSVHGKLTQGIDVQSQNSYDYRYKILVRQLLVGAKLSYVMNGCIRPYGLLAIGSSFNKTYSFSTTVPSSLTFTREYKNHTASDFTYAIGGGFDFEITNYLWAGVGYRFTNLGAASLGSASIDDTSVSGTLSQHHFYASALFGQLTLVF